MLNIKNIRSDFPILSHKIFGKDLIYFDNAATTQKPLCVINKISELYATQNANIHRGVHYLSQQATASHEKARKTVSTFINASSQDEIIFTRGTTESINLVAECFARLCQEGDEIILSAMEHHSNIVPWQLAAERFRLKIKVLPIDFAGNLLLDEYKKIFTEKTKIVAVTHVSNVLGTINDVKKIVQIAHDNNVAVLIDGAQAVAHQKIDVQEIDADFYAFSGHKVYAPTGIGILYGKRVWLEKFEPYQSGGEMIESVSFEKTTYNVLPYKFEAGTPDFISSVALETALNYMQQIDFKQIIEHENELLNYAAKKLLQIPKLTIYGQAKEKCGVISFNIEGIHSFDLGTLLDKTGVAIRTGHHCAQPLVKFYGQSGMARISFAIYNTIEEIDIFAENLKRCIKILS
ncbi:MAG: SufS family cysteine desulfurase [Prevotellaceae bacterium]|jgi:cysteine desulfurase/selenocysteine lyase|nr:SufS family cysteine desulfurase [Prevotellaceae bacterium]